MYWKIRNQVEGNISGMGPGAPSSATPSTTDARYRQQGRRMDRASDRYWDEVNNPEPQQARGWAKHNLGQNRGQYPAYLAHPELVAVKGLGLDPASNTADWLRDLPMADLAMITGGTRGKGLTRKTQPVKVPGVLKGQIDPAKPAFKRELDYSKYAKELAGLYRGATRPAGNVLDWNSLMGNLATARNKGALRQGIDMQAEYDPGGAMDRARGYIDSVIAATRPEHQQAVYADMADASFAKNAARIKRPKHVDRVVKRMARDLLR
jgi:hypothetical protein